MAKAAQHIVHLEIDNFKRIKAVRIDTAGLPIVQITGRNGQGKSSILDAIEAALGGKKHSPDAPIRAGEKSARVVVRTDSLKVTREFVGERSILTVTAADGARYTNPQEVLDKLWNSLTFDPLVFMRMKPSEQREALMRIGGVDPSEFDRQRTTAYDERRLVNRTVESLKATLGSLNLPKDPGEPMDLTDLMRRHTQYAQEAQARRGLEQEIVASSGRLAKMKSELAELAARIKEGERTHAQMVARSKVPMPAAPDQSELSRMEEHNRAVEAYRTAKASYERGKATLDKEQAKSDRLTSEIDSIDKSKDEALKAAKYPIDGLAISDNGVMFNGLPLQQASQSEQLRVSTAIAIAMNSELRVMLVRDGSLLDSESMELLETMARDAKAQVFIERVADTGQGVGVVIEDGEVANSKVEQPSA